MAELLYQFEESGVGCEAHSSTDCLCDVTPLPEVPIRNIPTLAPFPTIPGPAVNSFLVWASMTLGRFEALADINETKLNDALAVWEGRDSTRADKRASHRIKAAHMCLQAGLTFEQTARWLSTTVPFVMDLFYPREKHQLILEMEKHIRAGKTAKQIAEATGCDQRYAVATARRWGVALPHSGVRYPPELKAKARAMVKTGKSRRAVGRALGISETRVATWCRDLPVVYRKGQTKHGR